MTKEELIGLIKLNLGNAGNLPENQIHLNIHLAWEQMLFAVYVKVPAMIDRYAKSYRAQPVLRDTDPGTYYCVLPETPIRFADIAEGVRRVKKAKQMSSTTKSLGDDIIFVPMPSYQTQLISNVDAGLITDVTGYYVKDHILWFYHMNENITAVDIDIVRPFDKIDYEEDIPIPSGGVQLLIGITKEILSGVPYVDPRLRKINLQEV